MKLKNFPFDPKMLVGAEIYWICPLLPCDHCDHAITSCPNHTDGIIRVWVVDVTGTSGKEILSLRNKRSGSRSFETPLYGYLHGPLSDDRYVELYKE
jgi:hypothetical protein